MQSRAQIVFSIQYKNIQLVSMYTYFHYYFTKELEKLNHTKTLHDNEDIY